MPVNLKIYNIKIKKNKKYDKKRFFIILNKFIEMQNEFQDGTNITYRENTIKTIKEDPIK